MAVKPGRYTEMDLAQAFLEMVSDHGYSSRYGAPSYLASEVECQKGRPDYVALPSSLPYDTDRLRLMGQVLGTASVARVLSLLMPRSPRTITHIVDRSGLSRRVVCRALDTLVAADLATSINGGVTISSDRLYKMDHELWAFEIKLSNWKRALYQGMQYQAFAHRVTLVLTSWASQRARQRIEVFRALGIGMLALDPGTGTFDVIARPRKQRPGSRFHYFYALGRFLRIQFP